MKNTKDHRKQRLFGRNSKYRQSSECDRSTSRVYTNLLFSTVRKSCQKAVYSWQISEFVFQVSHQDIVPNLSIRGVWWGGPCILSSYRSAIKSVQRWLNRLFLLGWKCFKTKSIRRLLTRVARAWLGHHQQLPVCGVQTLVMHIFITEGVGLTAATLGLYKY